MALALSRMFLELLQCNLLFTFSAAFADMTWTIYRMFAIFVLVFACVDIGFPIAELTAVNDQSL
jgi:hypothetical protein